MPNKVSFEANDFMPNKVSYEANDFMPYKISKRDQSAIELNNYVYVRNKSISNNHLKYVS